MNIEAIIKLTDWDKELDLLMRSQPLFCACGELSPLGLPIFEQIGCITVQTGVVCEKCQNSFQWKLLLENGIEPR